MDKKDSQKEAALSFLRCLSTWAAVFKDKPPLDRAMWFDKKLLTQIEESAKRAHDYIKEGE